MDPLVPGLAPLSDKAKGKRRAIEPDENGVLCGDESSSSSLPDGSAPPTVNTRTFTVRFSEGAPDLQMSVRPNDTVREVQRRIREARPNIARRRLRLIHSGRLLTAGTLLHGWLASLENKQLNSKKRLTIGSGVLDSQKRKPTSAAAATASSFGDSKDEEPGASGVWVHCSIGPELPDDEAEEHVQTAQLKPLRGFDRLTAAGFSEEDIANVRTQFHTSRLPDNTNGEDGALQQANEDADEHARALEEQWIDDLDGANSPDSSLVETGIYTTLLQGLILGFFFPLLPFFYMRSPHPDAFFSDEYQALEGHGNVVFSRRMLMAVCFGFFSNVAYGTLRWFSV